MIWFKSWRGNQFKKQFHFQSKSVKKAEFGPQLTLIPQCSSCDSSVPLSTGTLGLSRRAAPSKARQAVEEVVVVAHLHQHHVLTRVELGLPQQEESCIELLKIFLQLDSCIPLDLLLPQAHLQLLLHVLDVLGCFSSLKLVMKALDSQVLSRQLQVHCRHLKCKRRTPLFDRSHSHLILCSLDKTDLMFSHILQALHLCLCQIQQLLRSPELWIPFNPGQPTSALSGAPGCLT